MAVLRRSGIRRERRAQRWQEDRLTVRDDPTSGSTRIVLFAGVPKSGRTTVIREVARGRDFSFIANNDASADMIRAEGCQSVDVFPFRSPCARVRQFRFRIDNVIEQEHPGS